MSQSLVLYGDTTQSLYTVWHKRLGSVNTVHQDQVQTLFNDLQLFPSKSQVYEMLHCARECNSSPANRDCNFLTFGEFCVFATELRKYYSSHERDPTSVVSQPVQVSKIPDRRRGGCGSSNGAKGELRTQRSTTSAYDVFLGGSCNPTTWRQDIAIPHLKSQGITFYNPQQANWVPEMIELEHQAKYSSQILFFVLNSETRNVVSMLEVSHFAGTNRRLVVVLSSYPETGATIGGEPVSKLEYEELKRGLETVEDLIERQGLPVFHNIHVALNCTTKVLKENLSIEELGLKDQAQPVRLAHIQIGDKLVRLREAFDTLDTAHTGKLSLAEIKMAFRIHVHRDLTAHDLRAICSSHGVNAPLTDLPLDRIFINFDEFCSLVSEYKNRGGGGRSGNGGGSGGNHGRGSSGSGSGDGGSSGKEAAPKDPGGGGSGGRGDGLMGKTVHLVSRAASWLAHLTSSSNNNSSASSSLSAGNNCSLAGTGGGSSSAATQSSSSSSSLRTGGPGGGHQAGGLLGRRGSAVRDVYLGGSVSSQAPWRDQLAIPMLKKSGLTFYNPAVCRSKRLIPIEASAMDNSRVLLFAITGNSRCLAAMCQAAYLIGLGCNVVLCVQHIPGGDGAAVINGEVLTRAAIKDYNRGRAYLSDFANREGVPVFDEISEALECVVQKCKSSK